MTTYAWKEGPFTVEADAQNVGEFLETLRAKNGGQLTAEIVVKAAKPKRSPIHSLIEWDDREAATQYRLEQARFILRKVVVTQDGVPGPNDVRAFVVVTQDDEQHYTSLEHAMSVAGLREQVLARAKKEAADWRKRYQDLQEFAEVFVAIDRLAG